MVNLDANDKDDVEEHTRANTRWTRDEEILLIESWIEVSENTNIENDRIDEAFWNQIMKDFNTATKSAPPAEDAYEAKRKKELGFLECKELEFLMIDPESILPQKVAYLRRKQQEIIDKYLEDGSSYINVSESAQDRDVGLGGS
ncbi:hypothetical protein Tco_0722785 [Tanacetum coccineum]